MNSARSKPVIDTETAARLYAQSIRRQNPRLLKSQRNSKQKDENEWKKRLESQDLIISNEPSRYKKPTSSRYRSPRYHFYNDKQYSYSELILKDDKIPSKKEMQEIREASKFDIHNMSPKQSFPLPPFDLKSLMESRPKPRSSYLMWADLKLGL